MFCNRLSDSVLTEDAKRQIYVRIEQSWQEAGFRSRDDFITALKKVEKTPITSKTLSSWASGRSAPNAERIIAISKLTEKSIDWFYTGVHPRPRYTAKELKAIVGEMIVEAGGEIPEKDPAMLEIQLLLSKVETSDQKAAIIRVIKAFVGEG